MTSKKLRDSEGDSLTQNTAGPRLETSLECTDRNTGEEDGTRRNGIVNSLPSSWLYKGIK